MPNKSMSQIQAERETRVRMYGSPFTVWPVPSISAGECLTIEVSRQFPESAKYAPLDEMEILNNDAVDVTVYVNGVSEYVFVPASGVRELNDRPLWTITVENNGAVSSVDGKVKLTMRRAPMNADKKARGL